MEDRNRQTGLDGKLGGLLSLESLLMDYDGSYQPLDYMVFIMSRIEELKKASEPWKLLDGTQYRTFQSLVVEQLGGDRRSGADRRRKGEPVGNNRRQGDRRWQAGS